MRRNSRPEPHELRRHDPDTLVLELAGAPVGFVACVQGIHVVLLGTKPESSIEISQHVTADSAIAALLEACGAVSTTEEHRVDESGPPSLAPVSPLVQRARISTAEQPQALTG